MQHTKERREREREREASGHKTPACAYGSMQGNSDTKYYFNYSTELKMSVNDLNRTQKVVAKDLFEVVSYCRFSCRFCCSLKNALFLFTEKGSHRVFHDLCVWK